LNPDHPNKFQKGKKIPVKQMWSLIEEILTPWDSVLDKTKMSDKQIMKLYSIITEADELFKMLAQIAKLKKAIDELTKK
jgi:hypothetical protein